MGSESQKEVEQRCKVLEMQNKTLGEQQENLEKELKQLKRKELIKHYSKLQGELWEIKKCELYGSLFQRIADSLQILIGFAESMDMLNDEKKDYYMWNRVAEPLLRAIEDFHGEYCEGKLILPLKQNGTDYEEELKETFQKAEMKEDAVLEQWIKEDERKKAQGKILLQERNVIWELTDEVIIPMKQMMERKAEGEFDWWRNRNEQYPVRWAVAVRIILQNNGIYPMFASDKRLKDCPELRKRFVPLKENAIRYPGLFIKYGEGHENDGEWEVLGAHIGMDGREEKGLA